MQIPPLLLRNDKEGVKKAKGAKGGEQALDGTIVGSAENFIEHEGVPYWRREASGRFGAAAAATRAVLKL